MDEYENMNVRMDRFPGVDLALWTAMLMVLALLAAVVAVVVVIS